MKYFFLKKHFFKVVSLVISISIWFFVVSSNPIEIEKEMTIKVLPPKGLTLANELPKIVKVKLKGPRGFLRDTIENDQSLILNFSSKVYRNKRSFNYLLSDDNFILPFGINLIDIKPKKVLIKLAKQSSKKVKIRANLSGKLKSDLKLLGNKVSPSEVKIFGPNEKLKNIKEILTVPYDLSKYDGESEISLPLIHLGSLITYGDKLEDEKVIVELNIRPKKANLTLKKIPVIFFGPYTRIYSKVRQVSIDVLAPDNVKISKSSIKVIAEIPEGKRGKIVVDLKVELPPDVHLLETHPKSITISVK